MIGINDHYVKFLEIYNFMFMKFINIKPQIMKKGIDCLKIFDLT